MIRHSRAHVPLGWFYISTFIVFAFPRLSVGQPIGVPQPFATLDWSPGGPSAMSKYGKSVAPAGDVNGDGFGDILVGAPDDEDNVAGEGRAFLYLGSPTGPSLIPSWSWSSGQLNAAAGYVVAPAGDLNRDGYADVLVGVPAWDTPSFVDAGKVALFLGGPNGLPVASDHEFFSPQPGVGQRFGHSAATAGDVNRDFLADVIIGEPNYSDVQFSGRGAAYIFHGHQFGPPTLVSTLLGGAQSSFGFSVSTAGDVNADSYTDVIIGAPQASVSAAPRNLESPLLTSNGQTFLYLGSSTGVLAVPDTVLVGGSDNAQCGYSVATAGDTNGDKYADVLVAQPGLNNGTILGGKVDLWRGGPQGLATGTTLFNSLNLAGDEYGRAVATLGDLDGDGYADFAVSSHLGNGSVPGRIVVFLGGRASHTYAGELRDVQPNGVDFGSSVATSGDVDGDGLSEILVGDDMASIATNQQEGQAYLFRLLRSVPLAAAGWPIGGSQAGSRYGTSLAVLPNRQPSSFPQLLIGDPGWGQVGRASFHDALAWELTPTESQAIVGTVNGQGFGTRVADAGDVDRNGFSDFLISSPTLDVGSVTEAGLVALYLGDIFGSTTPSTVLSGIHDFDRVGNALAGRGDVNGDGYQDVVIGARLWDSASAQDCGKAWLFYGSSTGLTAIPWTVEGTVLEQGLGASVALADLDADGYSDVMVGSSTAGSGPDGKVEVYYGGQGGPSATPGLTLRGRPFSSSYGSCVASVGDVSGDGVCDLAIGAPLEDGKGRAYVYAGTGARSQSQDPIWWATIAQLGARFGEAIAGGGDVDGDGIGDLVVGIPGYDGTQTDEGRIQLFYGAPNHPEFDTSFQFESGLAGAELGASLAPITDVNLDGFADVIAGAPGATGAVHAFFGGGGPGADRALTVFELEDYRLRPARLNNSSQVLFMVSTHNPAGETRAELEFEIRTQGGTFSGVPTHVGGGNAGQRVFFDFDLLPSGTAHYVRARVATRSPYFPRSRWVRSEAHESGDYDFWTSGVNVSAPAIALPADRPRLAAIVPNPAPGIAGSRVSFVLPRPTKLALDVYDVRGTRVRHLDQGMVPAGTGSCTWDGRDARGRPAPAGLYFIVLDAEGKTDRARLVRLP